MTILRIVAALTALMGAASPLWADCTGAGSAYYVDAVAGDDSNDGLSTATAWKTLAKVNASAFVPCDRILLKRGETWREQLTVPSSGAADQPITFGAYGSGANPVITGADTVTGWTLDNAAIYSTALTPESQGQVGAVIEDDKALTFLPWNTGGVAATFSGAGAGSYSFDYISSTTYVWATDGADPDTHGVEIATRNFVIQGQGKSYVDFENITLQHAAFHCVSLNNVDHSGIRGVTVKECGGRYLPAAGVYLGNGIEWGGDSSTYTLTNSLLIDNFDAGASPQINSDGDTQTNVRIEGNTFTGNGMYGVEVSIPNAQTGSSIENVTIAGNVISRTGKSWVVRPSTAGIAVYTAKAGTSIIKGVVVSRNSIFASTGEGVRIAWSSGTVTIERNRIYDNDEHGINVFDDEPNSGTELNLRYNLVYRNAKEDGGAADYHGLSYYAPGGKSYAIYNNVFYDNGVESYINANCFILEGQSTGTIKNNIFYGGGSVAFAAAAALPAASVLDYNLYYRSGGNLTYYNGTYYTTGQFAAFDAAAGSNADNGLFADPLFYGAAGGNFTPDVTSPAVDRGAGVGLTSDFSGKPVPQGAGTDIGAHELSVPGSGGLPPVTIHSNPLRPALGVTSMNFSNLPPGARLRVYTLSGELVRELSAGASGTASWNGRNRSGRKAASGVYFVLVEGGGRSRTLKVAIQR